MFSGMHACGGGFEIEWQGQVKGKRRDTSTTIVHLAPFENISPGFACDLCRKKLKKTSVVCININIERTTKGTERGGERHRKLNAVEGKKLKSVIRIIMLSSYAERARKVSS